MTQSEIKDFAAKLHEHFDAVQILVSVSEEGMTKSFYTGAGNWHARVGMAHDFIDADVAVQNANELKKVLPESE